MFKPFISFYCLVAMAGTTSMMLNRSYESRHPCLFSDLLGKCSIFHLYTLDRSLSPLIFSSSSSQESSRHPSPLGDARGPLALAAFGPPLVPAPLGVPGPLPWWGAHGWVSQGSAYNPPWSLSFSPNKTQTSASPSGSERSRPTSAIAGHGWPLCWDTVS